MKKLYLLSALVLVLMVACSGPPPSRLEPTNPPLADATEPAATESVIAEEESTPAQTPDVSYTLMTSIENGMAFIGVGGDIDGVVNPDLIAKPGDVVAITMVNGDGIQHDLSVEEFNVSTGFVEQLDAEATITFTVPEDGIYAYFCAVPGHRQAGMEGKIVVGEPVQEAAVGEPVVRNPADLPGPIGDREPEVVEFDLVAQEVVGQLADGTTYNYFTYGGQIPGPFLRARVGDTVQINVTNQTDSVLIHSVDLHAVTGPGGGAVYTQTNPNEETAFTFQALKPGIYVYHCATPSVPHHISSGMYGLILIEPEGGLPEVDKEFYVMQGEIYTEQPFGTQGHLDFSHEKMLDEDAEYFVFNGAAGALTTDENALYADVGDTVRIFFGVGGPNATSSFHIIGEIFDRVYSFGSVTSPPVSDVQTITVPPGGAWIVEFSLEVPGRYILVDHALSRLERGLAGFLYVEGDDNPDVFREGPATP